jgi:endonuclease YncB( thermonuclease family)
MWRVPIDPRRKRRWTRSSGYVRFIPLWGAAVLAGTAYGAAWLPTLPQTTAVIARAGIGPVEAIQSGLPRGFAARNDGGGGGFGSCYTGGGRNCVVDGDTFWMNGVKIRIAGIDAPETHPPHCSRERALGFAATRRLRQLLNSGPVTLTSIDRDQDRYGRKLRNVRVNGSDVGAALVREGLARRYAGGRRPWC